MGLSKRTLSIISHYGLTEEQWRALDDGARMRYRYAYDHGGDLPKPPRSRKKQNYTEIFLKRWMSK